MRLVAFGEDEHFKEASCLRRIYPPYCSSEKSAQPSVNEEYLNRDLNECKEDEASTNEKDILTTQVNLSC